MKIVCINPVFVPASTGNSMQVMKTCQGLVREGHEIRLLVPKEEGRSEPSWEELKAYYGLSVEFPIEWLSIPKGKLGRRLFPWIATWRALRLKPDYYYGWAIQSAVITLLLGKKTLHEMHDMPLGIGGPFWFRLFLRIRGKKRLLPLTQAIVDAITEQFPPGIPESDHVVSPDGVDMSQYEGLPDAATMRRELGLPEKITIACTGNLYAGRGGDLFVDLAKACPEANFMWVGGMPEDVEMWRAKAEEMHLENLSFVGFIENSKLPRYQAASDILLMPYRSHTAASSGGTLPTKYFSPMKMFDYLGAGKAIISTDLPVIREVLNETNAMFCPSGDHAAWIEAVKTLINEPDRRQALARQARQDAEKYTWQNRAKNALAEF